MRHSGASHIRRDAGVYGVGPACLTYGVPGAGVGSGVGSPPVRGEQRQPSLIQASTGKAQWPLLILGDLEASSKDVVTDFSR